MTDNDQISTAAPMTDDLAGLVEAGFEEDAAGEMTRTVQAAPAVIANMQTTINPADLRARVALLRLRLDNTPSMANLFALALMAHDRALDTVARITKNEPVDVLASASLFNARWGSEDPLVYAYTRLADARRFGVANDTASYNQAVTELPLCGSTAWFDLFAQDLAATAEQMATLEAANKTVYGMVGAVLDGLDNSSTVHTITSLAKVIRSFRRMKTILPFVIYAGNLPQVGEPSYELERGQMQRYLQYLRGSSDAEFSLSELADATLEDMVRAMFTAAGFDPKLVFMPGQEPRAIVQAFVSVSKMMASVSVGRMPEGLTEV